MGRFEPDRWRREYRELFDTHELVHNRRETIKIEVSDEGDGAFAVVDIDTLWRHRDTGEEMRWLGRVSKVYALVDGAWKLTQHTGALEPAEEDEKTAAAATAWVEAWLHAWPTKDAEPLAALYADDAVFLSHPFREPRVGPEGPREYVRWATEDQAAVECAFAEPMVRGDRAAVEWWAVITSSDGSDETVVGTSMLRFDADGRVVGDCAYWAGESGRHGPPSTFKPSRSARSAG